MYIICLFSKMLEYEFYSKYIKKAAELRISLDSIYN